MFKTIRVGIDHGNRNIKTPNFIFTSGVSESSKRPQRGENYLYYDNQYHVLSNIRIPYRRDKTLDKRFFTLTLFAILMELKRQGINGSRDIIKINLAIGLPPKHYAELYEKYESFFKGSQGVLEVDYTGQKYSLSIQNVVSFPQDYAAMITKYKDISKIPKVIGIDIGGFTTDYLMMRHGAEDSDYCDSLELGIIKMCSSILAALNSEFDILLEENDIDSIIEGNIKYYDSSIIDFVESQISNYVSDLLASIRERGIDTKTTYVVFIGGGSLRLRKYIEAHSERLNHYMFIEDICANAKGYEILYDLMLPEKGSGNND
jgi:hypothetical protein